MRDTCCSSEYSTYHIRLVYCVLVIACRRSTAQHMPNCSNKNNKNKETKLQFPCSFWERFILWNGAARFFCFDLVFPPVKVHAALDWPDLKFWIWTMLWVCQAHSHTNPRNCRCFSHLLPALLCRCPLYWFTVWHPFKSSYEIALPNANLQQALAPGSFPHPRAWPLSTLGSDRMRGFKSFTHSASRCGFLTDSRRCSHWQDVSLTQRLTWQNRRSDWAAS